MVNRIDVRKTHKLFIGGRFPRSESGRTFRWEGPDGAEANVCRASHKDFRDAVTSARGAFPGWAGLTAYNRGQIIYRCAEMLESRSAQFREELRLQGASAATARKEVARAVDLGAQQEVDSTVLVDTVARLSKLAARFVEPCRMSEVGTDENGYALDLGPPRQVVEGEPIAGAAGVWGV